MSEGADRSASWQTAAILAMIAEVNRDTTKRREPYTAADMMPRLGRDRRGDRLKPYVRHPEQRAAEAQMGWDVLRSWAEQGKKG